MSRIDTTFFQPSLHFSENVYLLHPGGAKPPTPPGGGPPSGGSDSPPPRRLRYLRRLFGWIGATLLASLPFLPFVGDSSSIRIYTTDVGKQKSIVLGGGSSALLNTDSVVRVWQQGVITHADLLRGEIFVDAIDSGHGYLVVSAGGLEIKHIGTRFAVRIGEDGRVRVTVVQGQVSISSAQIPEMVVSRNEQATVDGRRGQDSLQTMSLSIQDIDDQLSWRHGELTFHCAPIAIATQEFNRYNVDKFKVFDLFTGYRVDGMFLATDPTGFAHTLEDIVPDLRLDTENGSDGHVVFELRHLPPTQQRKNVHRIPKNNCPAIDN